MNKLSPPTIGIITALPHEYAAVKVLLDQTREVFVPGRGTGRRYTLGEVPAANGIHTIALSLLVDMGNNSAAMRASRMLDIFSTIQTILMVGIAGGVPCPSNSERHVRLGDIVISDHNGVIQYDLDKESSTSIEYRHRPRPPSARMIESVRLLQANEPLKQRPWDRLSDRALDRLNVRRPPDKSDTLADSHDPQIIIPHPEDALRLRNLPRIFIGTIAAANKLLKNPLKRDMLRDRFGVKAVEMESSGIADATWDQSADYLVIRGICDYCDQHKGDDWQRYAAIVAAAYTRALLESMPVDTTSVASIPALTLAPTLSDTVLGMIYYAIDDALLALLQIDAILAKPSIWPVDCDHAVELVKQMQLNLQQLWTSLNANQPLPSLFEPLYYEVKLRRHGAEQRLHELADQITRFRVVCRRQDSQTQAQREALERVIVQVRQDFEDFSHQLPAAVVSTVQLPDEPPVRSPEPQQMQAEPESRSITAPARTVREKIQVDWSQLDDDSFDDLVEYLLACGSISNPTKRSQIVGSLGKQIENSIDRNSSGVFEAAAIVTACRSYNGGLDKLINKVCFYEQGSREATELLAFLKPYRLT